MWLFDRFLRLLALASGIVLLGLMAFIVLDVVLRKVFNSPFSSSKEVTEFAMVLIVFGAIAYCGWTGGHIAVDLFEKALDRPSLRYLPSLLSFMGAALFAVIAWQATVETIATLPQVSNMLRMPHYPFRFTVAFGSATFAVVMFIQGIQALRQPHH
ncbi:MAG: TRAP transporter small permease subunit [Rhizobiales bacterium]|nr:TRAP transporter small permease subunit [Hyphomicrobiales bacterium]